MAETRPTTTTDTRVLSNLRQLTPYEFEKFVATLWELQGWTTRVTDQTGDAGVDIVCDRQLPFELTIYIQAKRYGENNKVGAGEMQKYVLAQEANADFAAVVTTSTFTSQATKLAEQFGTKLVEGETLVRIVRGLDAEGLIKEFLEADEPERVNLERYKSRNGNRFSLETEKPRSSSGLKLLRNIASAASVVNR